MIRSDCFFYVRAALIELFRSSLSRRIGSNKKREFRDLHIILKQENNHKTEKIPHSFNEHQDLHSPCACCLSLHSTCSHWSQNTPLFLQCEVYLHWVLGMLKQESLSSRKNLLRRNLQKRALKRIVATRNCIKY